jgi:hypothetical protein
MRFPKNMDYLMKYPKTGNQNRDIVRIGLKISSGIIVKKSAYKIHRN